MLPSYPPPSFFFLPLSPTPVTSYTGYFRSRDIQFYWPVVFFIIHLVSVFFHVPLLSLFKNWGKKTVLSVSINLHPERVTSYQDFKSASWFSDLLSVLINTDASHTRDTRCQLLNQPCAAFHFRNENLNHLFITVQSPVVKLVWARWERLDRVVVAFWGKGGRNFISHNKLNSLIWPSTSNMITN